MWYDFIGLGGVRRNSWRRRYSESEKKSIPIPDHNENVRRTKVNKNDTTIAPSESQLQKALSSTPWFKVVRLGTVDGIFSALAGKYEPCADYPRLRFKPGRITKDSAGIHIYRTEKRAINQADAMAAHRAAGAKVAVYQVFPLDAKLLPHKVNHGVCSALLFTANRVHTSKTSTPKPPAPPAPKWVDISSTLRTEPSDCSSGVQFVALTDGHFYFARLYPNAKAEVYGGLPNTFRVEITTQGVKVLKKA